MHFLKIVKASLCPRALLQVCVLQRVTHEHAHAFFENCKGQPLPSRPAASMCVAACDSRTHLCIQFLKITNSNLDSPVFVNRDVVFQWTHEHARLINTHLHTVVENCNSQPGLSRVRESRGSVSVDSRTRSTQQHALAYRC